MPEIKRMNLERLVNRDSKIDRKVLASAAKLSTPPEPGAQYRLQRALAGPIRLPTSPMIRSENAGK